MLQPGEIDLIIWLTKARFVTVFGDRKQLNFIPRFAGFEAEFRNFEDFNSYEFRNITRRCPKDVARLFYGEY